MTDTADMRVRVQAKIRLEAVLIALDIRCLGRGGWPIGALVDPLVQHAGVGEMRLLRPALSDLSPWCTTTGLRPVASPADARPARHFVIRALTRSARYVRRESAALGLGWPTAYCCNSHRGDCMGFGAQPPLFTFAAGLRSFHV